MEEKSLSNFVGTHPEKPYRATPRKLIFYPTPPATDYRVSWRAGT